MCHWSVAVGFFAFFLFLILELKHLFLHKCAEHISLNMVSICPDPDESFLTHFFCCVSGISCIRKLWLVVSLMEIALCFADFKCFGRCPGLSHEVSTESTTESKHKLSQAAVYITWLSKDWCLLPAAHKAW